jgi:RNA polymerase sigma-70 factor (ECF subfamily)
MAGREDEERLERLFSENYKAVRAYARRRVPNGLVDDIVAGTFLVAWRRLDEVPENSRPWLLAVARNIAATERRSARRKRSLLERLRRAEPVSIQLETKESGRPAVADALARLPERYREAITLVAWDELEPAEAAAVLGLSPGAFRVRLHRARGRLRSELNGSLDVETIPKEGSDG